MAKSTTVVLCVFALLALICIGLAQAETSEAPKAKFDRSEKGKAKDRITNNKENLNILNAEGREALEAFAKQPKTIKSSSGFPYQLIGVNADAESLADVKDADKVIFSISAKDIRGKEIFAPEEAKIHLRRASNAFQLLHKILLETKLTGSLQALITPEQLYGKQGGDLRRTLRTLPPAGEPVFITISIENIKRRVRDL